MCFYFSSSSTQEGLETQSGFPARYEEKVNRRWADSDLAQTLCKVWNIADDACEDGGFFASVTKCPGQWPGEASVTLDPREQQPSSYIGSLFPLTTERQIISGVLCETYTVSLHLATRNSFVSIQTSPDVILCDWLGSKHQLSNIQTRSFTGRKKKVRPL